MGFRAVPSRRPRGAELGSPHLSEPDDEAAGTLRLAVSAHRGKSVPSRTEFNGVLRLMKPLYLDASGQATYIVVNPGGAYFGERYTFDLEVGTGASLLFTTQSATRIHRTPGAPAVQEMSIRLRAGSRLEYVPDQLIAYRDATYRQRTVIETAPDAQGFFAEVLTPGWDPEGTRFTYTDVRLRTEVRVLPGAEGSTEAEATGVVVVDNIRMQPASIGEAIDGTGYLEGSSHVGSILILGPQTSGDCADRVREVLEPLQIQAGVTAGTRHGVSWLMVRALADSTDELNRMILAVNELDRSVTTGQRRIDLRRY